MILSTIFQAMPPHGDEVSCVWIIGGLVIAIASMAGYIVKREGSREKALIKAYEGRIADNKEHYELVDTLLRVVDDERKKRKGGS